MKSAMNNLGIQFPFMIAPMVGLSHVAFRELVKSYTPVGLSALRFTEMLSTRRLPSEKLGASNEIKTAPNESYFIPQILGNEERFIEPSVKKLMQLAPWGIDINMGCPVSHTLKHNWGVRLMGDISYAAEVVRVTKKHATVPVSVKLRGGAEDTLDLEALLDFTSALESAGADWLTIHPRPRSAGHKGDANWGLVGQVKSKRSVPVVANGDIQTSADAIKVCREFGSDGAMIARAATARPWILWQIAEDLGLSCDVPGKSMPRAPRGPEEEGQEYIRACLLHIDLMHQYFNTDEDVLEKFRFFAATGSKWLQFGHAFWRVTTKAKSVMELKEQVRKFGENLDNVMIDRVKFI